MASAAAMPSVSIGNYKGVMLCNRPFASVAGAGHGSAPAAKGAFVCGAVGDQLGVGATPSSREAPAAERPRKETALLKHRQWLRALQKTKEDLERTYKEEAEAKDDRHKKFTEREAKMRQMVRDTKTKAAHFEDKGEAKDADAPYHVSDYAEAKEESSSAEAKASSVDAAKRRPMWAMTADQAEIQADLVDGEEADVLLDFAMGLDFDKYINDAEVSALINSVRSRIGELEHDSAAEAKVESYLGERKAVAALTADNLRSLGDDDDAAAAKDDDAVSVARSLLESESGKSVRGIHSQKSLAAVAEMRRDRLLAEHVLGAICEAEPAMEPPKIIKHTEDGGSRVDGKHTVQNLPYMHRNPAV
ncbi:hypothetical protein M885DRAFT_508981 [Pelagophyceae sp. CCMP2097]|nr:hypothetical protein M885DRAFT_508981 [Pelagophyceae sp. CCMP2097]